MRTTTMILALWQGLPMYLGPVVADLRQETGPQQKKGTKATHASLMSFLSLSGAKACYNRRLHAARISRQITRPT